MLAQQQGLRLHQCDAGTRPHMRAQRRLLRRGELARSMATKLIDPTVADHATPDQRLVDIGDAHPESGRRLPDGHAAIPAPITRSRRSCD